MIDFIYIREGGECFFFGKDEAYKGNCSLV